MAKRGSKPAESAAELASSRTPAPPAKLHATFTTISHGELLHRVHLRRYQADHFNPGIQGNARFSPIKDADGQPVPTLYGGTTMECALMETVFHDVAHTAGFKSFDKAKLREQVHSMLKLAQPLHVIDLASVPLRKLGVTRKQLIDSGKEQYPATRKWAEAIHHQCPQAQGLLWVSRQDDTARAVILFGDRIPAGTLEPEGQSRSLLDNSETYDAVLDLADRIGVNIVPGKS